MSKLEQIVKDLQDTLVVIGEIERRQSALLKEHSERIVNLETRSAQYREQTDQSLNRLTLKLEEIGDKLNGLIGYVAGMNPPRPPAQ